MTDERSSVRLKIAVLIRGFYSRGGGAENYAISLVEMLALRHEVHVFTQHLDHNHPGVTYHLLRQCVGRPSWINLLCFNVRTWLVTRRNFDIVHSHENTWHGLIQTVHVRPVKVGLFYGRRGVRRFLRYVQIFTSPRLWSYLLTEHARFSAAPGKAVIACSESLRAEVEQAYPAMQGKVLILPPGVHLPVIFSAKQKAALRHELNLGDDALVLLFVGNDYGKKGLGPLLEALQMLASDVVLIVVGNSVHIPEFSKLATRLGVAEKVRFIGAVRSVERYYRAADALVHPTTEDSFSMVVLEALAHALPVVVSSPLYCGISENLRDEIDVLMLRDPRSVTEIATCINRLHEDGKLRALLGESGRRVATKYGWQGLALQQEAIYRKSLELALSEK